MTDYKTPVTPRPAPESEVPPPFVPRSARLPTIPDPGPPRSSLPPALQLMTPPKEKAEEDTLTESPIAKLVVRVVEREFAKLAGQFGELIGVSLKGSEGRIAAAIADVITEKLQNLTLAVKTNEATVLLVNDKLESLTIEHNDLRGSHARLRKLYFRAKSEQQRLASRQVVLEERIDNLEAMLRSRPTEPAPPSGEA